MRLVVKVVPNARENSVTEHDGTLVVHTTEPAERGRANAAVLKMLEAHFGKPVRLVSGAKARRKVVEVA